MTILDHLGHRTWIYQEGKLREVFVLETSASFLDIRFDPDVCMTEGERIAYVRGYFDAEGGLPQSPEARFYIQLSQKTLRELEKVRNILEDLGIECGVIHNLSVAVDPDYWRFFVRARSWAAFAATIGSWHPRKELLFRQRMMI
jgi:hypothetical protein